MEEENAMQNRSDMQDQKGSNPPQTISGSESVTVNSASESTSLPSNVNTQTDNELSKLQALFSAFEETELKVPEISVNFMERQGRTHSLQFLTEKRKDEHNISITVGIDSAAEKKLFELKLSLPTFKERPEIRFSANCDSEGKSCTVQEVEELVWNLADDSIQLVKKLSDNQTPRYKDVLESYWFNENDRPVISWGNSEETAEESGLNDTVQRFKAFLSNNWPVYDPLEYHPGTGHWSNIKYKITADEDDQEEEINGNETEQNTNNENVTFVSNSCLILLGACVIGFLRKFIINGVFKDPNPLWHFGRKILQDCGDEIFIKKPEVDLDPLRLQAQLAKRKLYFDFKILDTVCTALNSGDNIILTGGPGCGKTSLAQSLFEIFDYGGITATAASTWTTDELIGRYVPDTRKDSGTVLRFQKGYFLEAIKDKKWLLIDEMNRAPIDQCFGELFSILSGHSVELPFEDKISPDDPKEMPRRIRIAAANSKESQQQNNEILITMTVSPSFRLLCTMNDVDKDKLEQLSFALQRRFHIIRLDSPGIELAKKKIQDEINDRIQTYEKAGLKPFYKTEKKGKIVKGILTKTLNELFVPDGEGGLLKTSIVGMAQMIDIIKFAIRRLFYSPLLTDDKISGENKTDNLISVVLSGIALGIVTKAYPQFPNFMNDSSQLDILKKVINKFNEVFKDKEMSSIYNDQQQKAKVKIIEYLQEEFEIQFKRLPLIDQIEKTWLNGEAHDAEQSAD